MGDEGATHMLDGDLARLHEQNVTKDGSGTGSCLYAHAPPGRKIPEYNKNHSCSYRWQAHQVSIEERAQVYNNIDASHVPKHWEKRVYQDAKRGGWQCLNGIPLPQKGDWDLEGPLPARQVEVQTLNPKKKSRGPVRNFVTSAQWPYFFNCHHLIPKGLFHRVIEEQAAEQCADAAASCSLAIRQRLMKAKYNINHKVNMMILPVMQTPAGLLGLPRHLTRKPQGMVEKGKLKPEFRSHQQYDQAVQTQIAPIFQKAAKAFAVKRCRLVLADLDKESLMEASRWAYEQLLGLGKGQTGKPIAALIIKQED